MTLRLLPGARWDLLDAVRFYNRERPGLGAEFRTEVEAAFDRIKAFPEGWQNLETGIRRCRRQRFPYGVIYYLAGDKIIVVAVFDLRQRPGKWRDRHS